MFTRFVGTIVVLVLAAAFLPEIAQIFGMIAALIVLVIIARWIRRRRSTTIHIHHH